MAQLFLIASIQATSHKKLNVNVIQESDIITSRLQLSQKARALSQCSA